MFEFAGAEGGTKLPYFPQLLGRLVVVESVSVEMVTDQEGREKERLTANVTFLEGDTITSRVGRQGRNAVEVEPVSAGQTMMGMWVSAAPIIRAAKAQLGAAHPKPLFGRLVEEPVPGKPGSYRYVLSAPTAEEVELAGRWSLKRAQGQFEKPAAAPQPQASDPWS